MEKKVPVRMCIACRNHIPKAQLIRIVKNRSAQLTIDKTGKMEGRGAYLCNSEACLEKAYKKKCLERAFCMAVPPQVYETLKEALKKGEQG